MALRYKRVRSVDLLALPPDSTVSRAQAVRAIATVVRRPDETDRQARSRVSQTIGYALRKCVDLIPQAGGRLVVNDVIAWARRKWPAKFKTWPVISAAVGRSELKACEAQLVATGVTLPATIERCHELLQRNAHEIARLQHENSALRVKAERLDLLADRTVSIQEKRSLAGQWKRHRIDR